MRNGAATGGWLAGALVLVLCGAAGAKPVAVHKLADFASPEALEGWELRRVAVEPRPEGGVRLRYPAWREGGERWPAAILEFGQGAFTEADWRAYDRLVFDVRSENRVSAHLKLRLDDREGKRAVRLFNVPPGQAYTCEVPIAGLAAEINTWEVVHFDLYMGQPAADYAFVLEDIRLEAHGLSVEEAHLFADPFGRGQVRVRARLSRPARCEVRVIDAAGQIVEGHVEHTARLEWKRDGGAPGEYQVVLKAADSVWESGEVRSQLGSFAVLPAGQGPELVAWTEPGTRKVMLDGRPRAGKKVHAWEDMEAGQATPVSIDLARNEYEAAQVVFLSREFPVEFRFAVEGLRHAESGAEFPLEESAVYQVGYVFAREPGLYAVDFAGWWPDPLLPAGKMRAAPGECMPVWISLKSGADTEPGIYRGRLVIRVEGEGTGWLPLEVRVYDAVLPDSTSVRTAFSLYDHMLERIYGEGLSRALYRKYQEFVADHRLNIDHLYRSQPPRIEDLAYFAARSQLNAFNLLNIPAGEDYGRELLEEIAGVLDPYVEELRRRGLVDRAYVYGFDEVGVDQFDELRRVFGFLKERYPDVKTATTARDPGLGLESGLDEVVDIWVPLTATCDRETADAARSRGDEVWWYICISPTHPFANWFIEYPAIEARLLWWMAYQQGVTGFLYYTANRWPNQDEPMRVDGNSRTNWNPASYRTANGDGCLFYAGPDEPITTIRLENVRDGIEDYELLRLLEESGGNSRSLCDRLIRSLTEYTRDVEEFERTRRKALEELEERVKEKGSGK